MPVLPNATVLLCFAIAAVAIMVLARQCRNHRNNKELLWWQGGLTSVVLCTVSYGTLSQYYQAPWFT